MQRRSARATDVILRRGPQGVFRGDQLLAGANESLASRAR
jgi:hypothetical protein